MPPRPVSVVIAGGVWQNRLMLEPERLPYREASA
jgi:hypothetical protein